MKLTVLDMDHGAHDFIVASDLAGEWFEGIVDGDSGALTVWRVRLDPYGERYWHSVANFAHGTWLRVETGVGMKRVA